jgi:hypothetical protein
MPDIDFRAVDVVRRHPPLLSARRPDVYYRNANEPSA